MNQNHTIIKMNQKMYIFLFVIFSFNVNAQSETTKISPIKENIAGTYNRTLTIDGKEREFIVYIPKTASGKKEVPVVFMIHGTGGNGKKFHDKPNLWSSKAKQMGFISIHPSALSHCHIRGKGKIENTTKWAAGKIGETDVSLGAQPLCPGQELADDMKFFDEMVSTIKKEYAVNPKKIYVTGFSNGGGMAYRLAVERSDIFAAVAVHAGGLAKSIPTNLTSRPLSMIISFGANDPLFSKALNLPRPLSIKADLMSNSKLINNFRILDIQGLNNKFTYSEGNIGNFATGEFLFDNNLTDYKNYIKLIVISNLDHNYPSSLVDAFWSFFEGQTL